MKPGKLSRVQTAVLARVRDGLPVAAARNSTLTTLMRKGLIARNNIVFTPWHLTKTGQAALNTGMYEREK